MAIVVLIILVIAAGLWFEPGYVLVMVAGHSVETSLMALSVLLLLLWLLISATRRVWQRLRRDGRSD